MLYACCSLFLVDRNVCLYWSCFVRVEMVIVVLNMLQTTHFRKQFRYVSNFFNERERRKKSKSNANEMCLRAWLVALLKKWQKRKWHALTSIWLMLVSIWSCCFFFSIVLNLRFDSFHRLSIISFYMANEKFFFLHVRVNVCFVCIVNMTEC